jgi:hypothetical protein
LIETSQQKSQKQSRPDGSVLAIGAGLGFGALLDDVFALMSLADIILLQNPNFRHVDFQVNPDHKKLLAKPITQWLKYIVAQA